MDFYQMLAVYAAITATVYWMEKVLYLFQAVTSLRADLSATDKVARESHAAYLLMQVEIDNLRAQLAVRNVAASIFNSQVGERAQGVAVGERFKQENKE